MSAATQAAVVQIPASEPPLPSDIGSSELTARDAMGLRFVGSCTVLTAGALALSSIRHPACWLTGQVLLAFALLEWFAILHEAGHNTLFRTKRLNQMAGRLAAIFAMIPFGCWKSVHGMHHHWTGWQDLDMTTAPLVPRRLVWIERTVLNVCWKCWLPLFSILYRINNYWNLYRMFRFFPDTRQRRKLFVSVLSLLPPNTTASGRATRRASERSGVQRSVAAHRLSLRERPAGQEGETYARMAKLVSCAVGMQVPRGDHPEVPQESVLRTVAEANRSDPA
jgi:hypothetical protein